MSLQQNLTPPRHRDGSALILTIAMFLMGIIGCERHDNSAAPSQQKTVGKVRLVIDWPDDENSPLKQPDQEFEIDCFSDSTVFSVLQDAKQQQLLTFSHRQDLTRTAGSIFVQSINSADNRSGNFWTFYLNDQLGNKSCGIMGVRPSDTIRWKFGPPDASLTAQ